MQLPCGTGKSLIAYYVANALNANLVIVAVPSLALVRQSVHDVWLREEVARERMTDWLQRVRQAAAQHSSKSRQGLCGQGLEKLERLARNQTGQKLTTAFSRFPSVHKAALEGRLRVEFTRSPNRPATPASCALLPSVPARLNAARAASEAVKRIPGLPGEIP